MKMHHSIILLTIILITAGSNSYAQESYPFLCRGPFAYAIVGEKAADVKIIFKKNDTRAGATGALLKPGTCAWTDRPINPQEPSEIYYTGAVISGLSSTHHVALEATNLFLMILLQQVAASDRFILNIRAYQTPDKKLLRTGSTVLATPFL